MFSDAYGLNPHHVKFSFDGDKIPDDQSAMDLELEDDDIIEAKVIG